MKPISMAVAGTMIFVSAVNTQPVQAQNSGQSATETSNANLMEEIVVSARRRDESIQDIPISVSAITEETITQVGISGVEALSLVTPNLQINREISQGGTPFLRGVGSPGAAAGAESPLAIYVDDVYIGSPNGNLFELNAIDNIQVFKGPQGTLFGRNATGGVIMVNTKRPTFDPTGEISLGYGNYDTIEGSFYGSTGLSDNVAVNFAASGRDQQNGYGRSLLTGNDTQLGSDWDVRGKLLWNASEATTILLSADYSEQKSDIGSNASPVTGSVSL
ncbi:MAG: TonB-dependent receptor plug domain-containing protein, partial [Gammaproteobacteria bacterium]|nr:TonB-dependent receptor plug domain-containing protein [Gammaproteobacteria bacterium]